MTIQFSEYNYNDFPLVKIKLNNSINNDNDYNDFVNKWIELYERKTPFWFIIDTTNIGMVSISYAYKMGNFIKNLKKNGVLKYGNQWLQRSIIIVNNNIIASLLKIVFYVSPPIAPVFIVKSKVDSININYTIDTYIEYYNQYDENNNNDILSLELMNNDEKNKLYKDIYKIIKKGNNMYINFIKC